MRKTRFQMIKKNFRNTLLSGLVLFSFNACSNKPALSEDFEFFDKAEAGKDGASIIYTGTGWDMPAGVWDSINQRITMVRNYHDLPANYDTRYEGRNNIQSVYDESNNLIGHLIPEDIKWDYTQNPIQLDVEPRTWSSPFRTFVPIKK